MSCQHYGWLISSSLFLGIASSSQVVAQTLLVRETFRNAITLNWKPLTVGRPTTFVPCLTAGNAPTSPDLIPACNSIQPLDLLGAGALRLTDTQNDLASFIYYNVKIPSRNGLVITFDYFSYGGLPLDGSQGDGISFFLFDGDTSDPFPGAFGGSLGYAPKLDAQGNRIRGLFNAYVGVGLDEFGGFATDSEGRGPDSVPRPVNSPPKNCAGYPLAAPTRVPDSITIRGSGFIYDGYCFLANSGSLVPTPSNPNGIDNPNVPSTGTRRLARRTIRITLTPNTILTVEMNFGKGFRTVIAPINLSAFPAQAPRPKTFKLGFAASTGSATNIHEIRDVRVTTFVDTVNPPPLPLCNRGGNLCQF